ncbi:Glutamate synthase [NADPH] large chain [hydrothermal vent metagenome]|uniref:Glutamate synthase [NADPH] large chain n=1 Tax=hydrothermal vent metagenome TaxID=652676 RepID=A0A3B0RNE1_9ZZZZ
MVDQRTKLSSERQICHLPKANGLYDPRNEHDACGLGMIANINNKKEHKIVADGLKILANLEHRGAVGADPKAGDGCGMLIQIPHRLFSQEAKASGFDLPEAGQYGVGFLFLPQTEKIREKIIKIWHEIVADEGLIILGWRKVPTDSKPLGYSVIDSEPDSRQIFVGMGKGIKDTDHFERKLFVVRKAVSNRIIAELGDKAKTAYYPVSLSSRTIVYKALVLGVALAEYYSDLKDPRTESALCLIHQRFSTNTFPSWPLAHPYRMVCHNGEINTVRGNYNWMAARQANMSSDILGDDLKKLWPISYEGQSDTACFDNALELLCMGGYSLAHAMMMLIPEAWAGNPLMSEERRTFYEYHASMMEPWDGPAAVAFTDGRQIGATLDRNGLRPSRYIVTDDGYVMLASEMGVLDIPEEKIVTKWRLQPGKMLLIDLEKGVIISDEDLKAGLAKRHDYRKWLDRTQIMLSDLPQTRTRRRKSHIPLVDRQQTFGYTQEDLKFLMIPMAQAGQEATGSMGTDTPVSVLSNRPKLLDTFFKQNFAQVTNPPIDPIREEAVMSLVTFIGPRPNLLDLKGTSKQKRLEAPHPIITNEELERIRIIGTTKGNDFKTVTIDATYDVANGPDYMDACLEGLSRAADRAVRDGYNIIIISDRSVSQTRVPVPILLATSAIHHHLIRKGLRTSVGLVVESGEPREVHQFCTLAGYGAEAINPYLAFETLADIAPTFDEIITPGQAIKRYIKALKKGILKVMSKMGISTYQSYCGAQIFDAVGLSTEFVERYFTGTASQVEGIGLNEIAHESFKRHTDAFGLNPVLEDTLEVGGEYAYRIRGEAHAWSPETVADLQHAVRGNSMDKFREFSKKMNADAHSARFLRGLFHIKSAKEMGRKPVPLDDVEPASKIVKRFATGAMSYGSISREAHTTLAIAMNRIGAKSNTGEGGEEPDRFAVTDTENSMRSAIKQVASGRFGVTAEYLVNADMIQIKMAQGAKPGEGGQLPGHKVNATIAKVRHSTPGVGLISPPPHHDIYSIEDLAQLIYDLKNVNQTADISVKLVSEVGVGTVAAGVAKARADHITISGYDGGTGASPLTSIKHAGSPWEIGIAETQQTLVENELRSRVVVQVDGGLRTGRDMIIAALLGADEMGFATAPLIAAGCIMMRKCHLNTCPVGIATQDAVLRKRFTGLPEHVINYFFFVAEEARELMAYMGFKTFNEMVGQVDWLDRQEAINHWKAQGLDFTRLFAKSERSNDTPIYNTEIQDHHLEAILDRTLIEQSQPALEEKQKVSFKAAINNTNRSTGAMLSGEIAKRYGHDGLPEDTINIALTGIAGQSFGAFAARGLTLDLTGEANDYVGKGLAGGRLIIKPPANAAIVPEESIIVGNTVLYGAIAGECYFRGVAGERFAVRNSGAVAVVEGVGDHGCEYMTGGVVVVIGQTGRNFAAGMSGGVAYVLDEDATFASRCNLAMVDLAPIPEEEEALAAHGHQAQDLHSHGLIDLNHHLTEFDAARLRQLIENHKAFTNSTHAAQILDNWDAMLPKFIKVMPVDYRRALLEMEQRQTASVAAE